MRNDLSVISLDTQASQNFQSFKTEHHHHNQYPLVQTYKPMIRKAIEGHS